MAFKAPSANKPQGNFEPRNFPVPKKGNRPARVSLIVDLGIQEREDIFEKDGKVVPEGTEGAERKSQKPAPQVAVFVDLVRDVVDYGGEVGKQPYRLMLNNAFKGVVKGINFTTTPPKDAKGKLIEGKPWTLHPQNVLTKLAKATGNEDVIVSTDIEQLLNGQLMINVDVKETPSGKDDADGNEIIYKNVNPKEMSPVAAIPTGEQDADGNDIEEVPVLPELKTEAKCITFDSATKEDIKWIRSNLIKMIKLANNYSGSKMQKAIEAYEAEKPASSEDSGSDDKKVAPAKPKAAPKKPLPKTGFSDMDDEIPF